MRRACPRPFPDPCGRERDFKILAESPVLGIAPEGPLLLSRQSHTRDHLAGALARGRIGGEDVGHGLGSGR